MQYPNRIRGMAPDDIDLMVSQWQTFNQQRYLRSELGLEYDTFIDLLSQDIPFIQLWEETIKPGNKPKTAVELLRSRNYNNVNFGSIDRDKNLNYFLFALQKVGVDWEANNPEVYDLSSVKGAQFIGVDSIYAYAPAITFDACVFKDFKFDFFYAYQAKFSKCQLEHGSLNISKFNTDDGQEVVWDNCIFDDVKAIGSDFSNIQFQETAISDCYFRGCYFELDEGFSKAYNIEAISNSVFNFNTGTIKMPVNGVFENNDAHGCMFRDGSIIQGWCQENDFFGSRMTGVTFDFFLHNSSFREVNFITAPTFGDECEINGCDFTNSNIDDHFTATELRDAVKEFDETTLWVDGTPLTEV